MLEPGDDCVLVAVDDGAKALLNVGALNCLAGARKAGCEGWAACCWYCCAGGANAEGRDGELLAELNADVGWSGAPKSSWRRGAPNVEPPAVCGGWW